jgi:hypothetical protein
MIVIFKNESGLFSVRAAYIGFIKNNIARRILCTLFFPFILICTIAVNLVQAAVVCLVVIFRAFWHPLSRIKPIWKTDIWHRPRTKADSRKTLN